MRLALAQINSTVGDLAGNTRKILEWIDHARSDGADLVAFSELAVTGYGEERERARTSAGRRVRQ